MDSLFVLRVTLRSGASVELLYETAAPAAEAKRWLCADAVSLEGAVTDDFGHAFSVRAGDVESCTYVDFANELRMKHLVSMQMAQAQQAFQSEMQRRQAAAGKLLIPAGAAGPVGPAFMNGGGRPQ